MHVETLRLPGLNLTSLDTLVPRPNNQSKWHKTSHCKPQAFKPPARTCLEHTLDKSLLKFMVYSRWVAACWGTQSVASCGHFGDALNCRFSGSFAGDCGGLRQSAGVASGRVGMVQDRTWHIAHLGPTWLPVAQSLGDVVFPCAMLKRSEACRKSPLWARRHDEAGDPGHLDQGVCSCNPLPLQAGRAAKLPIVVSCSGQLQKHFQKEHARAHASAAEAANTTA